MTVAPDPAEPVVSIVLCTNRAGAYLPETLASVLDQSFAAWELRVVDDGSPDPEALLAVLPDDPRISVTRIAHQGLPTARNVGCAGVRGHFVTFLDDDDLWPSDRLERQLAALDAAGSATIACCGRLRYIDGDGAVFGEGPPVDSDDAHLTAGFHIGTVLVRTDALFRSGLFNPFLPYAEDLDFSLRLGHVGPIVGLPEFVLDYRRHGDNMSNQRLAAANAGRTVYEHYYRLAGLAGDRRTQDALARCIAGLERYQARSALRAARAAARRRDVAGTLAPSRAALRSLAAVGRYSTHRPGRDSRVPD